MRKSLLLPMATLLLVSACGGDSTGPKAPTYENIAGTYSGAMIGLTQGVALNAIFSLTIVQNAGVTSGSYGLSGTLNDGFTSVQIAGTGTLDGTVGSGANPSVNITVKSGSCPNYRADFSGAYDSANHRITLTGPVDILNNNCTVFLRYSGTIILNR